MPILWAVPAEREPSASERRAIERLCGCPVEVVESAPEAVQALEAGGFHAALGDFPIDGWAAEDWLEEMQRVNPAVPVIIRHRDASLPQAVRLTKLGAFYYLPAETPVEELASVVREAIDDCRSREAARSPEPWKQFLVGESAPMRTMAQIIRMVAPRRCTVLISGETGTGKELVARAVHGASGRGHLPFVAVNCAALPEALLEAELFGHVRGAFTGAVMQRVGRFEQAHRGSLFLDEVGEVPLELQAKLLRVIQERAFERLGSSETVQVDVRIIAASNQDLGERVRQGLFREDLYYRLNVVPITVAPLRDRPGDIPLLIEHFLDKICREEQLPRKQVVREVLDRLCAFSWPGNVRQLENALAMAVALSGDERYLRPSDFPLAAPALERRPSAAGPAPVRMPADGLDFDRTVARIELSILMQALERAQGNKNLAARMLHLKRTTFAAKLKKGSA